MNNSKVVYICCLVGLVSLGGQAAASEPSNLADVNPLSQADDAMVPLIDMGDSTYLGFSGGLYPNSSNLIPSQHETAGLLFARRIRPRNTDGFPDPAGKYVLLSVGMSNTTQEYCYAIRNGECNSWTFGGQAAQDPEVNHTTLEIVDGAAGGQTAETWTSPDDDNYDRVRDEVLEPRGLSEAQVEIVWIKEADGNPGDDFPSLPDENANAYNLESELGQIARALKVRYPNLQQVFFSSRIYGGYATVKQLNPEPYAYESGFSAKWLIEAQIRQMQSGQIDPIAGNLSYNRIAPWLAWSAYLWAEGRTPRSDGLVWLPGDFERDMTHPSTSGETKVGSMLLDFFKTSDLTRCWFLEGLNCRSGSIDNVNIPFIDR